MRFLSSICFSVVVLCGVAQADDAQITYTISKSGTAVSCTHSALSPVKEGATQAFVKVETPTGVTVTVKDGTTALSPNSQLYKVALDAKPHVVTVAWGTGANDQCEPMDPTLDAAGKPIAAPGPAPVDATDVAAANWLSSKNLARAFSTKEHTAPDGTVYLVHLPSGQPAFPFPAKLTEGTKVQVVLLAAVGEKRSIALSVDGCADLTPFRTTVDASDTNGKQGLTVEQEFVAMPIGQYFSCGAGTVSYTLKTEDKEITTTKITFRPKYTVAAIASVGWDTGRRVTYSAGVRSGSSEATVFQHKDHVGIEDYIGAMWMIGGVDYEDMKWWNYFANVFVAVDPTAPTKDVVAGFAITPTGGISASIGISFHKGEVLDGIATGNPVNGEVPKHESWNEKGEGLFLGLAIDSRIYDAVVAKFSK